MRLQLLVASHALPINAAKDREVAFAVIEAHNLWSSFARAFYLSCALSTRSSSGKRILASGVRFKGKADALLYAVRLLKTPTFKGNVTGRDEPTWHRPANIVTLFRAAGMSNVPDVQAALCYPTVYFDLLPKARHFYAHRNADTRMNAESIARSLGLSVRLRPTEIMCSRLPLRPQHVLADWLSDMRAVVDLLCG